MRHVADILAKKREERSAKALRLSLLGWTQREIGERLGTAQKTITGDLSIFTETGIFAQGHAPAEIARRYGLPLQVVYAAI